MYKSADIVDKFKTVGFCTLAPADPFRTFLTFLVAGVDEKEETLRLFSLRCQKVEKQILKVLQ